MHGWVTASERARANAAPMVKYFILDLIVFSSLNISDLNMNVGNYLPFLAA